MNRALTHTQMETNIYIYIYIYIYTKKSQDKHHTSTEKNTYK